jgi:Raf kinase inhibitor-like YbhB/YbcL family protein
MRRSLRAAGVPARVVLGVVIVSVAGLILTGCGTEEEAATVTEEKPVIELQCTAFGEGDAIPSVHTCDGEDISPELSWSGAPEGTRSFALIMDDPDAPGGIFTHWVIFNIPAGSIELAEGIPTSAELPTGARQGRNSFGRTGYDGPCPPQGTSHHYHFVIYALDEVLDLAGGASKGQVLDAMEGHVLGEGELVGIYER